MRGIEAQRGGGGGRGRETGIRGNRRVVEREGAKGEPLHELDRDGHGKDVAEDGEPQLMLQRGLRDDAQKRRDSSCVVALGQIL